MTEEQANRLDSTTVKRFAGEIFESWKRTRDIREEAKENIRPDLENEVEHRQGLYEAAENAGLPLSALKLEVGRQKLDWENEFKKKAREAKAGQDIVELADMMRDLLGGEKGLSGLPLGDAAVSAATGAKPKKGGGKKGGKKGESVDTSVAAKANALSVGGDDDADLRSSRQKEREELRKAEAAERLKGIKPLDDQPTVN